MDCQFGADVAAVCRNGVHGDTQSVGNLLVAPPFCHCCYYLAFAASEAYVGFRTVRIHRLAGLRTSCRHNTALHSCDNGNKNIVLNTAVAFEVVLAIDDVEQHTVEQIGVARRTVPHQHILKPSQLMRHGIVVGGEDSYCVAGIALAGQQPVDIGEKIVVLIGRCTSPT